MWEVHFHSEVSSLSMNDMHVSRGIDEEQD